MSVRYESMVIVDPVVAKSDVDKAEAGVKTIIEKCGGTNIEFERYGERKLAYKIGKFKRGFYFLIHFDLDGNKVPTLLREYKLSDEIFRYIVFRDEDAAYERRDLAKPVMFNIDSLGKSKFDRAGESGRDRDRDGDREGRAPVGAATGSGDAGSTE